ncbi:MAG: hypothetical protein FWH36_02300 [Lentimicrobiaceae bacterium]|nr:hypothetical protein [Lentimicrobiaceae bacterium]
MSKEKITVKSGILPSVVFIVFLVFKLAEIGVVAKWSWWWVFAPLWMPAAGVIAVLIVGVIGFVVYHLVKKGR